MQTVTVVVFKSAIEKLCQIASDANPVETGGVLIGTQNVKNGCLKYTVLGVVGITEYDSFRESYIATQSSFRCTDKNVWARLALEGVRMYGTNYIGDWHSHHEFATSCLSITDIETIEEQFIKGQFAPYPPVHLIVPKRTSIDVPNISSFIMVQRDLILRLEPEII